MAKNVNKVTLKAEKDTGTGPYSEDNARRQRNFLLKFCFPYSDNSVQ
jgi:hypothetical protein